jgi:hypothetical protein
VTVPEVFPIPREIDWGDPAERFTGEVLVSLDASLPAQGYELSIRRDVAHLRHGDDLGRRYGEQTLDQLRATDGSLPQVHVRDWPDIAVRGFMLDISRDRVPTMQTLERLVSVLATARYNHLQLYIEHTFAYRDHRDVWRDASPMTAEEMAGLDDLCAEHGIELVANQNCFGHMGRWLALDRYRSMADSPDGAEVVEGFRIPPSVLAPTEANAEFAVGLVREQMAALESSRVNVGCDETFELGRGLSAKRAGEIGRAGVYMEHLNRIVRPLLDDGCQVMFWGDVVARDPERLADLVEGDLTALVWNYDAPEVPTPPVPPGVEEILSDLGIDLETPTDFETRVASFREASVPFWVAPGTSSWQSLIGRWDNARANLIDAATTGRDRGAGGFLVTDWGDNGHQQPPSVSDLPILYGGAVGWCAQANAEVDVASALDRLVYQDGSRTLGRLLETVGGVAQRTGRIGRNVSPLFAALFPHQLHLVGGEADASKITAVIETLDRARDELGDARPLCADGSIVTEELDVAIGLARFGALRLGSDAGLDAPGPAVMRDDLAGLIDRYRSTWAARSRPGGLSDSVAHLETTLATYLGD